MRERWTKEQQPRDGTAYPVAEKAWLRAILDQAELRLGTPTGHTEKVRSTASVLQTSGFTALAQDQGCCVDGRKHLYNSWITRHAGCLYKCFSVFRRGACRAALQPLCSCCHSLKSRVHGFF